MIYIVIAISLFLGAIIDLYYLESTNRYKRIFLAIIFLSLTIFVGFRDQVGGDWWNYQRTFEIYLLDDWESRPPHVYGERIFEYFFWTFARSGISFEVSMLLFSVICLFPLFFVLWNRRYPIVILSILYLPYILIFGTGFIRQGLAAGFLLIGYHLMQSRKYIYGVFVSVASLLFHFSSLILALSYFAANFRNFASWRLWQLFGCVVLVSLGAGIFYFQYSIATKVVNYVFGQVYSAGALFRHIPSLFFFIGSLFILSKTNSKENMDRYIGYNVPFFLLALFLIVSPLNVVVDRFLLFWIVFLVLWFDDACHKSEISLAPEKHFWLLILFVNLASVIGWILFSDNRRFWSNYMTWII